MQNSRVGECTLRGRWKRCGENTPFSRLYKAEGFRIRTVRSYSSLPSMVRCSGRQTQVYGGGYPLPRKSWTTPSFTYPIGRADIQQTRGQQQDCGYHKILLAAIYTCCEVSFQLTVRQHHLPTPFKAPCIKTISRYIRPTLDSLKVEAQTTLREVHH